MMSFEEYIDALDSLPFLTRCHWHDYGWSYLYRLGKTDYYINAEFGRGDLRCYKSPQNAKVKHIILCDFQDILSKLPRKVRDGIIFNIDLFR